MLRKPDAKPSNQEAFIVMNRTVDWPSEIQVIAGEMRPSDTQESWLARAARLSGSTFWHIKSLYKGDLTDPKYSVAYKIVNAATKARFEEARRNVESAETIVRETIARLESSDAEHHRTQIDALRTSLHLIGERDSA